jgi:hypothetical protein
MTTNNEPSSTVSNGEPGRLGNGTFGPKNTFGRGGNPYHRRIHQLRGKLLECATDDELVRIMRTLGDLAVGGDVAAARLWLEYTLGKAPQAIQLSGPDGEPIGGDLSRVRVAILACLGDEPETRYKIARALMALEVGGVGDDTARDDGVGA